MMDRQKGKFIYECDGCKDTLETDTGDFHEALETIKGEGWRSVPPKRGSKDWSHYCGKCPVPQGAVR